ncbi:MAG: PDZ domain-containing protein [Planctomycetes bacterium]|nr:PDZ domain-containing protein [Planctomycetota bacterium]
MNRYFVITFGFLPVFVIAGVLLLFFANKPAAGPSTKEGLDKEFALYLEVRQKLLDHYDGEIDEQQLADQALVGLAEGTGDRYTHLNPPIEAKSQDLDLRGQFFGIDCQIENNEDGSIRITTVQAGGGGEKAGLLADDVIVGVDGVSILGQPSAASRQRIISEREGTVVKLSIARGGDPKKANDPKAQKLDIEVTRSRVVQYSVNDVHVESRGGKRFGYLAVAEFNANTFEQFRDAINDLGKQGVEGYVVDLRFNGGGRVPPAVDMADSLLREKDALIVFTKSNRESNRKYDHEYRTKDDTALTDLPVVLLVDGGTASASEIFSGAMRDYGRVFIVGERTFGKGIVQTIFNIDTDPRYSLNITTTQYFTPLGRKMHKGDHGEPGGILPDLLVPYKQGEREQVRARMLTRQARYNLAKIAETSKWWNFEDRQLNAALDVLAGKPVAVKEDK